MYTTETSLPNDPPLLSWQDLEELTYLHDQHQKRIWTCQLKGSDWGESETPEEEVRRLHLRYLHRATSRFILLGKKQAEPPEYMALDYVCRGTDAYIRRSKRRARQITDRWRNRRLPKGMMIRVSPRATGSVWENFKLMKELWPKYTNWLRSRPEYRGAYLWACEPTKRHYPHWHMVLGRRCKKSKLAKETLLWFQKHGVDIEDPGVNVQHVRGDASTYALKYVTKGCEDPLWSAILWLSGKRIWGASRVLANVTTNSQAEHTPEWEMIASVPQILKDWILQDRPPPEDIKDMIYFEGH